MANLELIKQLNDSYGKSSPIAKVSRAFSINESFDPRKIEKAFSDTLNSLGPEYISYFKEGKPTDVAMLFIDVCSFSSRFAHYTGKEIGKYFDHYYDLVIPIVYDFGGEVEKIMGDGIICVFGPPFQNLPIRDNIYMADKCSKEIIKATKGSPFSSKIAFHCGKINYYTNKTGLYKEYTMVGKPLTELFRLESISIDECINYYGGSMVGNFFKEILDNYNVSNSTSRPTWLHNEESALNLKGVAYKSFFSIKYNN